MNFFDMNSEVCNLRGEEERILASCTRRLIEIAAVAGARGPDTSPAAALNAMHLPAIALDRHGFVAEVNAAAEAVFDNDVKIKDRRLFARDPESRALLKDAIDQFISSPRRNPLGTEPVIVQRQDKLPVIVRIWPFDGAARVPAQPAQEVRALLTKCLGAETRAAGGDPRQDIPPHAFGGEARLRYRTWRLSRYRGARIEDFTGGGAQSVEIGLCQDRHPSPKRTCRAAFTGLAMGLRKSGRGGARKFWRRLQSRRCAAVYSG